ncbi:Glycosyl transferases group 1 [Roseovarius litorisediminis]|uniref:Glycosyl transferases group 1 n=1 Tax=Roseovarius litorisediminis TaxID=1312363 RepID=A0A1Y5SRH2_9RHOB|nr:glycosyltransferase [Roseovarius litorisediminis]SLN46102.1 Glycosyl transferases group 1 [Roseovarius litorisediminis]
MKILFYNWVDYLDDEKRGGGVGVYQKNLIHALGDSDDVECLFLSSGISYDLFGTAPRWERVRHGSSEDRKLRFEIVNSGVLSPAHHSFGDERQIEDRATTEVFFNFIRKNGPFDVVHFNNLEGLPAKVLSLKELWPDTRVVFSLHNYYPICPQVNLWWHEKENCLDFDGGRRCTDCLEHRHDDRVVRLANAVAFRLKKLGMRPGTWIFDHGFGPSMRWAGRSVRLYNRRFRKNGTGAAPRQDKVKTTGLLERVEPAYPKFARRRSAMVEMINTYCDHVLCVSEKAGEVAARFGISPALIKTGYIGTRHAEKFAATSAASSFVKPDGTVTLAYLGYMRRDKGFFFLLDALEALPVKDAARINVVICSKLVDSQTMDRITQLSEKFASVLFADGYAHDQLDELLSDVDLGLIPVLWEDNLPQVAIEMHARHIPLMTSDLGGAQELGRCPDLVFKAGDVSDFARVLGKVLSGKLSIEAYWAGAMAPYTMDDHLSELRKHYAVPARPIAQMPSAMPAGKPLPKPAKRTNRVLL